jgi:hypothetical protein
VFTGTGSDCLWYLGRWSVITCVPACTRMNYRRPCPVFTTLRVSSSYSTYPRARIKQLGCSRSKGMPPSTWRGLDETALFLDRRRLWRRRGFGKRTLVRRNGGQRASFRLPCPRGPWLSIRSNSPPGCPSEATLHSTVSFARQSRASADQAGQAGWTDPAYPESSVGSPPLYPEPYTRRLHQASR